ncbi:uncharacterized protein PV06_01242 [Exophiala oligosperma]|uniref:PhoD-like phosphatase domain-containing protein n=1 Tax=Exophiala oligosperma TaxID=215243 RepID=A0A0D2ELB8_9EURO|nr:uncharacterized protein PV06_01242 [Exophiala oligosperma]KIW48674.1 hypothetical protein PV06_01242 [Exophiala oligosperma]
MNPHESYHDPVLDDMILQNNTRTRNNDGGDRRNSLEFSRQSQSADQTDLMQPPLPVAPEVPRGPPIAYRGGGGAEPGMHRSFSQRAKGRPFHREAFADVDGIYPEDENINPKRRSVSKANQEDVAPGIPRKPLATDGLRLKTTVLNGNSPMAIPRREAQSAREPSADLARVLQKPRRVSETPRHIEEPISAVSRSSALRDEAQRRDWAPDRSPLQKLEVTLNDINKEAKRARVQEAEMLMQERNASKMDNEIKASREQLPTHRSVSSSKRTASRREPPIEAEVPTLEDAGLVRNLSTTHRQRLQHSTTLDNHRPDIRTLSGEGPSGFDYTVSSPLQTGSTSKARRQSTKYRSDDVDTNESPELVSKVRAELASGPSQTIQSRKRQEPQSTGRQSSRSGGIDRQPRAQETQNRRLPQRESLVERQNASHKAALEKPTGVSAPNALARDGSRKLQKPRPTSFDPAIPSDPQPSRIPVPTTVSASRTKKSENLDLTPRTAISNSPAGQRHLPHTPPPAIRGLQPSPHPSSPRSPPEKVADAIRQRQRKSSVSFKEPMNRRPVDEWKEAGIARLTAEHFSTEAAAPLDKGKAWWEQPATGSGRRRSRSTSVSHQAGQEVPIDDKTAEFKPRLYLRCGPLLRYTGIKKVKVEKGIDREVWRGSVLIVTQDSHSSYEEPPTLRLFCQPQKLLPPPPHEVGENGLRPEYIDPVAGLTKLSRTGRALYVRPIDHLEEGKDLSQLENDDGLFESSPSPTDLNGYHNTPINRRTSDTDGERLGRYSEVKGARLYADPDRDVTFWRFNIEIELMEQQQHIAYRINRGASAGFWVPAQGQTMNIMFHSCNGFSLSVNPNNFSGPDPLWRDVLNTHETRPFHVMIGGGDQIYNDRVMIETQHFGEWTRMRNPAHKHSAPFTHEMKEELETFYLNRYSMWFSQGLFGMAASQIPMVNIWDDHDIIDGFGSYPHHFMETPVFSGIGNIAFKYYMLFQHQSVPEETTVHEPSWVLGREPGPYIKQVSRSVFMQLGKHVAFLGVDCRTERMRHEVLSVDTLDIILERCRKELIEGETKHLLILLGVPIAYPRLVWLENVLTSRLMDPVKALGRAGVLKGGFLNKFDGGVEILDDLDDHWTAKSHKRERNDFIKDLQDLAAEKSCRITILSGDVHLAAVGQFHSNPKLKIPKDRDHRYMPNIISSAIVNTPPSDMLADILNKRNKTHHLDMYTDENMIPMFTHDVDYKKRNNTHLLPRRNWCSIQEYIPGSTPPPSPTESPVMSEDEDVDEAQGTLEARPRRFSFSKEDVNPRALLRRLSSRRAPPTSYRDAMYEQEGSASHDGTIRQNGRSVSQDRTTSGSRQSSGDFQATARPRASSFDQSSSGVRARPNTFQRRPTNLSEKAARKGNIPAVDAEGNEIDVNDHINLEGGLDIVLNVEVSQKQPAGITIPYRLLVPALWYDGSSDREKLDETVGVQRKPTLLNRFGLAGRRPSRASHGPEGSWGQVQSDDESFTDEEVYPKTATPRRRFSLFGSRKQQKTDEFLSDEESDHEMQSGAVPATQQMQPWQQSGGNPQSSQPYRATTSHDILYDTESRPPPNHSLEPSKHPSTRRSLTIGSASNNRPMMQVPRTVSDSHSSPAPPSSFNTGQPPVSGGSGEFPMRRLRKQERVLGISPSDPQPHDPPNKLRGNGIIGKEYLDDPSRGYGSNEAYQDPRPRRTFSLKKARNWLDGRPRDDFD